jgi:hypothetical protein
MPFGFACSCFAASVQPPATPFVAGGMTPMDDIEGETPASQSSQPEPERRGLGKVGPESEARGGSEAPDERLDAAPQAKGPPASAGSRPDGFPGERAALPEGTLSSPFLGTQGDENRQPPVNAPAPVNPATTVDDPPRPEMPDES